MRKFLLAAAAIVFAIMLYLPQKAEAVPAFARQTGMACNTCHYQHFTALNAFGRTFVAGGYTMIGGQSLVEGDVLSLPSVLNAALVTKIRYQKTNGDDDDTGTNRGELQFPEEAALFLAGRAGEHMGFILEGQLAEGEAPTFASFKMPVSYQVADMNLLGILYTTDGLGASYGFEILNTGAVRHTRILDHRRETSAQQYIGTDGAAQGVAFVAHHNTGYINYSLWQPEVGTSSANPLHYLRIAATPQLAGWDFGIGGQLWAGESKLTSEARTKAEAWAVDAQAQGRVGNLPLGVYITYANAEASDPNGPANRFNSSTAGDENAWTILGELGVIPGRVTLAAGYRDGDNGAAANSEQNALTFGATYLFTQNVQLSINHTAYYGDFYDVPANNEGANGDQLTSLTIFAGF